jgi:hypothetical protein
VAERLFDEMAIYLEQRVAENPSRPAAEQLQILLTSLSEVAVGDQQRLGLYADFFVQAWQQNSVREILLRAYDRYTALLTSLIQGGVDSGEFRAVDAEATAQVITGSLDGIYLRKLLDPMADLEKVLGQLTEMVMRTLRVDKDK